MRNSNILLDLGNSAENIVPCDGVRSAFQECELCPVRFSAFTSARILRIPPLSDFADRQGRHHSPGPGVPRCDLRDGPGVDIGAVEHVTVTYLLLRYPTADEAADLLGRRGTFQGGCLVYNAAPGVAPAYRSNGTVLQRAAFLALSWGEC